MYMLLPSVMWKVKEILSGMFLWWTIQIKYVGQIKQDIIETSPKDHRKIYSKNEHYGSWHIWNFSYICKSSCMWGRILSAIEDFIIWNNIIKKLVSLQ